MHLLSCFAYSRHWTVHVEGHFTVCNLCLDYAVYWVIFVFFLFFCSTLSFDLTFEFVICKVVQVCFTLEKGATSLLYVHSLTAWWLVKSLSLLVCSLLMVFYVNRWSLGIFFVMDPGPFMVRVDGAAMAFCYINVIGDSFSIFRMLCKLSTLYSKVYKSNITNTKI